MGQGPRNECPTLRTVLGAHQTDISAACFDHDLSLFATAATDGTIRVYDFQFAVVEAADTQGDAFNQNQNGHRAEITSMSFVGGRFPCLVTSDCAGILCMWAVRPCPSRGKLIHRWANLDYIWDDSPASALSLEEEEQARHEQWKKEDAERRDKQKRRAFLTGVDIEEGEEEGEEDERVPEEKTPVDPFADAVPVDAVLVCFSDDWSRGPLLMTADEEGFVGRWDLRPLLKMVGLDTPIPMSKSPTVLASYSAHRRSTRNAETSWDNASSKRDARSREPSTVSTAHSEGGAAGNTAAAAAAATAMAATNSSSAASADTGGDTAAAPAVVAASGDIARNGGGGGQVDNLRNLRRRSLAERLWGDYQKRVAEEAHAANKARAAADPADAEARRAAATPVAIKQPAGPLGLFPNHLQLATAVPRVLRWKAHAGSIHSLSFIDEAPFGVATCSIDLSCRVWSLTGQERGTLAMSDLDKEKILQGRLRSTPWTFRPNVARHIEDGIDESANLVDSMVDREAKRKAKKRKDRRRKKSLEASKAILAAQLSAEFGGGGARGGAGLPENPLRAGLAMLQQEDISDEQKASFDNMLGRVASMVRGPKQSRGPEDDEDGAAKAGGSTVGGTEARSDPVADGGADAVDEDATAAVLARVTTPLQPALRPYLNYDKEMSKSVTKSAAIMEVEVDCAPSPFLRSFLGEEWRRKSPGERLDERTREAAALAQKLKDTFTSSHRRRSLSISSAQHAQSAPQLHGIGGDRHGFSATVTAGGGVSNALAQLSTASRGGGRRRAKRRPSFDFDRALAAAGHGAGGAASSRSGASSQRSDDNTAGQVSLSARDRRREARRLQRRRERMHEKVQAFERTIGEVVEEEAAAEARERSRTALKGKDRAPLYETYDGLTSSDDEGESKEARRERLRLKRRDHDDGPSGDTSDEDDDDATREAKRDRRAARNRQRRKATHFGSYTVKEVLELRKLFNAIDDDASGSIDVEEFVNSPALSSTHLFMNATSMFESIDRDASGTISFGELLAVAFPQATRANVKQMLKYVKAHESQEHMKTKISLSNSQVEEINNIFKLYDVDHSGGISTEELYEAMVGANPAMREIFSLAEMDKLVRQYDDDGNATLELEEFTKLFKDNFLEDKSVEAQNVVKQTTRGSTLRAGGSR